MLDRAGPRLKQRRRDGDGEDHDDDDDELVDGDVSGNEGYDEVSKMKTPDSFSQDYVEIVTI